MFVIMINNTLLYHNIIDHLKIFIMSKTITLPYKCKINEKMIQQLDNLLETVPPTRLKNRLLRVLLQFLIDECHALPVDFDCMIMDYFLLFDFLTVAEQEMGRCCGDVGDGEVC